MENQLFIFDQCVNGLELNRNYWFAMTRSAYRYDDMVVWLF